MSNFKLASDTGISDGTSLQGYVETSFAALQAVLGPPNCDGDEYKVSTEWTLEGAAGEAVTVYDYKMTNLYSSGLASVESFRAWPSYRWHVGAHDRRTADEFVAWLSGRLGK